MPAAQESLISDEQLENCEFAVLHTKNKNIGAELFRFIDGRDRPGMAHCLAGRMCPDDNWDCDILASPDSSVEPIKVGLYENTTKVICNHLFWCPINRFFWKPRETTDEEERIDDLYFKGKRDDWKRLYLKYRNNKGWRVKTHGKILDESIDRGFIHWGDRRNSDRNILSQAVMDFIKFKKSIRPSKNRKIIIPLKTEGKSVKEADRYLQLAAATAKFL